MGSNQFQFIATDTPRLCICDGIDAGNEYILSPNTVASVGRKEGNQISLTHDQHLSLFHSKVFKVKGVWYVEDLATTNGY